MPRRQLEPTRFDHEGLRNELNDRPESVKIGGGDLSLQAVNLPLFRSNSNDGLEQVVRVIARNSSGGDQPISVSLSIGKDIADEQEKDLPSGLSFLDLFVPEVESPTAATLSITCGISESEITEFVVEPQRKWTVSLIHHSHFDYGYTDPQAIVLDNQLQYLDSVLDLISQTDDWPDDAKFRWNVEVTYPLQHWLKNRPTADCDEFFRRVQEGRIEINGLPFSMHSEVYSIDELAWGFNFTDELRHTRGVVIDAAIQSDVPGATVGLLNLMTAADIKYLAVAHNYAGRSIPFMLDGQELTRPFWWQAENGKRVLVWYTDTPHGVAYMEGTLLGFHESADNVRGLLPTYLAALAGQPYPYGKSAFGWHGLPEGAEVVKQPYPWDMVHFRVQNTFADNSSANLEIARTVKDWNEQWAFPHLRMDLNSGFFKRIESAYGDHLQTYSGDWTDWWVDGVGSAARPLGINRRAQNATRTGRTLHALADVLTGETSAFAESEIETIYENMALFDEHTWGAANPWLDELDRMESGALQWERKASFAQEADERSARLVDSGIRRFAQVFQTSADSDASLLVFNPDGQPRTDLVRVFLPDAQIPVGTGVDVIDIAEGKSIAHVLEPQEHQPYRAKGQWLTFVAEEIPGAGYARFDVNISDRPEVDPQVDPEKQLTLESEYYRVEIDPAGGFVSSILDLSTNRELVNADAPFGFNEYIYERYGTAPGFNHLSGRVQAIDDSYFGSRTVAGNAAVVSRVSNAIEERITLRLTAEGADWLEATISLPKGIKRVDFSNRLMKQQSMPKESGFFAFPLSVEDANPEYEITGGVSSKDAPHVPGSSRHMFAVRNWIGGRDRVGSVTWATAEAPLVELDRLVLPYVPFPATVINEDARLLTIYSWVHNNIWDTNFPQTQGGEMTFCYSIRSGDESIRALGMQTAASLAQPLVGLCLSGRTVQSAAQLPSRGGFLEIANDEIELVAISPSRNGSGITAFLQSQSEVTTNLDLSWPLLPVKSVSTGNFLERNLESQKAGESGISLTLTPGEYMAVVMELER